MNPEKLAMATAIGVLIRCVGGGVAFYLWQGSVSAGIAFAALLFTVEGCAK